MSAVRRVLRLHEVLSRSEESVVIAPASEYLEVTVRLWGKGAIVRRTVTGSRIAGSRRFVARAGQLIVSRIDARHGAVAIVPPELDGAVVTNDFPVFDIDRSSLEPGYLDWMVKTRDFTGLCARASEGTTNRVRLQVERFLELEVSLPPLEEQKRAVLRLQNATTLIGEASRIAESNRQKTESLRIAYIDRGFARLRERWEKQPLGAFNPLVTSGPRNFGANYADEGVRFYRAQDISADGKVRAEGKVFVSPPGGRQARSAFLAPRDLLIVITGATVGRAAVFREGMETGLVSQHVALCRFSGEEIDPDFIWWGLYSSEGQRQLLGQKYGQGKPGLNLSNIRSISLSIPPLDVQRTVAAGFARFSDLVDKVVGVRTQIRSSLTQLQPAMITELLGGV
jgi:type I restriction enzyme, S subunit